MSRAPKRKRRVTTIRPAGFSLADGFLTLTEMRAGVQHVIRIKFAEDDYWPALRIATEARSHVAAVMKLRERRLAGAKDAFARLGGLP